MPNYPPAAKRLIQQVTDHKPDAEIHPAGDPDGFGRTRALTFDSKTSRWLRPLLEACDDRRIADITGKSKMTVTFVSDYHADFGLPFALDEADQVLNQ